MKIKVIVSLSVLLSLAGCGKLFKDDELTLAKQPYIGNELRLDGYYYLMSSVYDCFDDTYFFYRDGTALSCEGSPLYESPFNYMERLLDGYNNKYKTGWGVFKIEGDSISIERWWFASESSGVRAGLMEGIILNDTTFQITSITWTGTETVYKKNDIYHFHAFTPKPDSTNQFIQ